MQLLEVEVLLVCLLFLVNCLNLLTLRTFDMAWFFKREFIEASYAVVPRIPNTGRKRATASTNTNFVPTRNSHSSRVKNLLFALHFSSATCMTCRNIQSVRKQAAIKVFCASSTFGCRKRRYALKIHVHIDHCSLYRTREAVASTLNWALISLHGLIAS